MAFGKKILPAIFVLMLFSCSENQLGYEENVIITDKNHINSLLINKSWHLDQIVCYDGYVSYFFTSVVDFYLNFSEDSLYIRSYCSTNYSMKYQISETGNLNIGNTDEVFKNVECTEDQALKDFFAHKLKAEVNDTSLTIESNDTPTNYMICKKH